MPDDCIHHWRIAERQPHVRYAPAVCRRCGVEREMDCWAIDDRGDAWKQVSVNDKRRRGGEATAQQRAAAKG